ncbi:MAG: hypothetical protein ABJB40_02825 [Acidobacteriota bacterium]
MNKFFKNRAFTFGFLFGIVTFLAANALDYLRYVKQIDDLLGLQRGNSPLFIDVISRIGLPLPIFYGGQFVPLGLVLDILISVIFSFVLGILFRFIWSKLSPQTSG